MTDATHLPGQGPARSAEPSPRHEEEISRLQDLHTRLVDTKSGFDKVLEKAQPDFAGIAAEFQALHALHAERVRMLLRDLGAEAASDGSLVGTVNRAVVEVRSWFDDIDHNVMDGIVDGEKRLLGEFQAVIAASPSVERRVRMEQMREETLSLLRRHAPEKL
ncbi:MAG: DUF2383 domain-containing protein [Alkalilacustris sp.]